MGKIITIEITVVSTLTDQQFRPFSDGCMAPKEINAVGPNYKLAFQQTSQF